jgi:uncharacterized protein YqeY
MALKDKLEADIKTALLAGEKTKAETLKMLKSAILYEEVALKLRDVGLSDEQVVTVFSKEAKKRAESAELYQKAGESERAKTELTEKAIIDEYLPKQMDDTELQKIVEEVIAGLGDQPQMGQAIGAVRAKVGSSADGGRIAAAVKSKLGL